MNAAARSSVLAAVKGCVALLQALLWAAIPLAIVSLNVDYHGSRFGLWRALYSAVIVQRQLDPSERAFRSHDLAGALALALPVLREHPGNTRALYWTAGLYWAHGDRALATFYSVAYLRSDGPHDPDDVSRLARLLESNPGDMRFPTSAYGAENVDQLFRDLKDRTLRGGLPSADLPVPPAEAFEDGPPDDVLRTDHALYALLPGRWYKTTPVSASDLLNPRPEIERAGLFQISWPAGCQYAMRLWCLKDLRNIQLFEAIAQGAIALPTADCTDCRLALSDPDLRALPVTIAEFIAARAQAGLPAADQSAEGIAELVAVRERVALKQYALLVSALAATP